MTATQPSTPTVTLSAGMLFEPVEHHPRSQREDQEDQQRKQIPGETPEQAMIGEKRIGRRFGRRPRNDGLRHVPADRVDLSRDHSARAR